jgi:hypothetical protein
MKPIRICMMIALLLAQGCSHKKKDEKITITDISGGTKDAAATHNISEEKHGQKIPEEISKQPPIDQSNKFKLDDDNLNIDGIDNNKVQNSKPIMVALMAPMTGKNDMIGNAIMDGAHMSLMKLFAQYKIPIKLSVIDTGSGVEDIEFNISKLDESKYDMVLGLTSDEQERFVGAYLEHNSHKPIIVTLNPASNTMNNKLCAISPQRQMQAIAEYLKASENYKVYAILSQSEDVKQWQSEQVKILQYTTKDVQQTNDDLDRIAKTIKDSMGGQKVFVIFTDANWKLQKFMTKIESLNMQNDVNIILASLSNLNGRMQSTNEKRHKFGNIAIVTQEEIQYNNFIKEFYQHHQKKPLELAFWSYNAIQTLKDASFDTINQKWNLNSNVCTNNLKVLDKK